MIDAIDGTTDQNATRIDVRHITPDQLQQLGVSQLAYVKRDRAERRGDVRHPCGGRLAHGRRRGP